MTKKIVYNNSNEFQVLAEIKKLISGTKWENNVFLVGGAVRDYLMGKPIKDIDLCVSYPNGGIEFAEWICKETDCYKKDSNPCVFLTYGTAKFNIKSIEHLSNIDIEVVQTRKEQYKDKNSRNPEVCFGSVKEDAYRRDLTINALYLNISTDEIIDPTGEGFNDIENHIIKSTSNPDIIFNDDPLRVLRVIRFASRYDWKIEKNTWLGLIKNVYRLDIISKERIKDELVKILTTSKVPSIGLNYLYNSGILKKILPEIYSLVDVKQGVQHFGDVYQHTLSVVDKTQPYLKNRVSALFHDVGKPTTLIVKNGKIHFYEHETKGVNITINALKRLSFSNKEIKDITNAIRYHMVFKQYQDKKVPDKAIRKFINKFNDDENLNLTLDLIDADNKSHADGFCLNNQVNFIKNRIKELNDENENKIILPINGNDIMKSFNLKASPLIGNLLSSLTDYVIEHGNKVTRNECLDFIERELRKVV